MNRNELLHGARMRLLPVLIALGVILPGCASSPVDQLITLEDGSAMARQSAKVQEDATLTVRLHNAAGSVYSWRLVDAAPNLALAYQVTERDSAPERLSEGGGAWEVFSFVATEPGRTRLRFAYHRAWDTNTPPQKPFTLDVEVTK